MSPILSSIGAPGDRGRFSRYLEMTLLKEQKKEELRADAALAWSGLRFRWLASRPGAQAKLQRFWHTTSVFIVQVQVDRFGRAQPRG